MSGWTLRMAPCGAVHTGDFIFPWQTDIRQDAETDSQQETRILQFYQAVLQKHYRNLPLLGLERGEYDNRVTSEGETYHIAFALVFD